MPENLYLAMLRYKVISERLACIWRPFRVIRAGFVEFTLRVTQVRWIVPIIGVDLVFKSAAFFEE
jgi:hypothetical protein